MHAEILSIGNEIISGQLLDTNSQWLSQRLEELGLRVLYHTVIGDNLEAMAQAFQQALGRADVIVSTGGLGPTPADLTRQALAKAAARELVLDPACLEHVRQLFARRKRPMPASNEVQAYLPEGSRAIPNPNGTAPGIDLEFARAGASPSRFFALPGVPAEMKEMWAQTVVPRLREAGAGQQRILHRRIKCFGAGESHIESLLPNLINRNENPRIGITASQTVITLRLAATGATEEACLALMEPIVRLIRERLGKIVFGEDDDELQDAVLRLLHKKSMTVATVEWGTAGQVAERLGGAALSQDLFLGGLVVPGAKAVGQALDLPADLTARPLEHGRELVTAMADTCRKRFGSDLGLAVGPFPPFDPDAAEPYPVHIGLASIGSTAVKSMPFAGHPAYLKVYCANHALDMVRLRLMED